MELAGVDYYTAKEALVKAEGDLDKALEDLAPSGSSVGDEIKDILQEPSLLLVSAVNLRS